jgi:glucosyl-3-phosphoglycerate synthase
MENRFYARIENSNFTDLLNAKQLGRLVANMSDFYQHGGIATLHHLGNPDYTKLEKELNDLSPAIALVLPCHARDLDSPVLAAILEELSQTRFIRHVIVGLDGADETQCDFARSLFQKLPQETAILWNDGPRMSTIISQLEDAGMDPGARGKGRNMRLCFGYALSATEASFVAVHDCDIVNYRREMLARLCFPVAHPEMAFEVSKGFSARFSDRLNGRVMRLLISPLLRAMEDLDGFQSTLGSLQNFRYPISGEVCLHRRVVKEIRFPSDWGVETGMMADVFRLCEPHRVCQVDIAETYDHKHQDLSEKDPLGGLNKMACDVTLCLLRTISAGAEIPISIDPQKLVTNYLRLAREMMRFYSADARINLLQYDSALEDQTATMFASAIARAISIFSRPPAQPAGTPGWSEIEARLPGTATAIAEAVRLDEAQADHD